MIIFELQAIKCPVTDLRLLCLANSNLEKNKSGVLDFSVGSGTGNKKTIF